MNFAHSLRRLVTVALAVVALVAAAPAAAAITWSKAYGGLTQPVEITSARDGSGRLFIIQQTGQIRVIRNGSLLATPFLDLSGVTTSNGEQGLLGAAFHPQYASNRQLFVNYTRTSDGATVIARYTAATTAADVIDPATAQVLLVIAQPYGNHNGGSLKFGADGFLYIGMGDGGDANDPQGRAQDKTTRLGKILRIDVDHGAPYAIPPGNPFANGVGGLPEIFAIGLRNPWRISFDRANGDFWIGDVGQGAIEEIDLLPAGTGAGANFGWRVLEGTTCTGLSGPVTCTDPTLTAPVLEYTHSVGCSVTGGFVYRGAAVPALAGQYVYGDFCSGRLWAAQKNASNQWIATQLGVTGYGISGFGEDDAGELYFADYGTGDIYRFADTTPPTGPVLSLTATSLAFGDVVVGVTSPAQTVTVTNAGVGTLSLSALTMPGAPPRGGAMEFTRGGSCAVGTGLTGAQSCTITFTLKPTALGARTSSLAVASNGGNATIPLAGNGVVPPPAPVLSPSATTLSFGSVLLGNSSATQTITIANGGGGTLTLASLTAGGANPGDFTRTGTCANGTSLAAAQSCTVIYRFTPTSTGARAASLAIASNGGAATINLSGSGTATPAAPVLALSAGTLAFGNWPLGYTSGPQTITVTNAGAGTLTLSSLTPGGAQADFPRTGTCAAGTGLTAGQSCTLTFRFAPTAVGPRSANLAVASNGGSPTITLTGTASSGRR
jgi:glucose/arabinose dehydrogenase